MRRIGVAFPGADPASPATWSGTPAGIIAGLEDLGFEAIPISLGAPPPVRSAVANVMAVRYLRPSTEWRASVRRARGAARATPMMSRIDTMFTPRGLGEDRHLDGIIQIGTGVSLRTSVPTATYEDMTVAQNLAQPYEQYALLSDRAMRARIRRQLGEYERAVACCLATDWAARSVADDYSVADDKIHVVGVGCHPLDAPADRDWSSPRFLFVGMDWERKNGPGVLRAFNQIQQDMPAARLDVVGAHPPLALDGVHGHGVLRRDVPDERRVVDELFRTCTCFVMPSHLEAAGIVYLEAASAGVPVIGTSIGGASFLIGDGGLAIDPHDDDALAGAMKRFADGDVAAAVGAIGRRRSTMFTWSKVAERLTKALSGAEPDAWWETSESNPMTGRPRPRQRRED